VVIVTELTEQIVMGLCPTDSHVSHWRHQKGNLSLRCNGHFPDGSVLTGTGMSAFWILLDLRMMEVVSGDNWSYKTCKAPNRHHQQTNTNFFTGRMSFLSPNYQRQSTEGKTSERESVQN